MEPRSINGSYVLLWDILYVVWLYVVDQSAALYANIHTKGWAFGDLWIISFPFDVTKTISESIVIAWLAGVTVYNSQKHIWNILCWGLRLIDNLDVASQTENASAVDSRPICR